MLTANGMRLICLAVMLLTPTLAHLQSACSTEEKDSLDLLQRSTLLDLSPGQEIRVALHNHTGEALLTVMLKGHYPALHKALGLVQSAHMDASLIGPAVLFVAVCFLLVSAHNRIVEAVQETCESPSCRTQVPIIPGLRLPQVEDPYEALQPALPMAGAQRSFGSVPQLRGQLPPMRPMLGSQSSIMSGTSRSISYSPRHSVAEPRLSPYAVDFTAAAPSGEMHYNMMTARSSAASIRSGRTPSPYRNSTTASAILSPRYSTMSTGAVPSTAVDRVPPLNLFQSSPRTAANFLRPTPRVALETPRDARGSTASQEGLKGVRGRVKFFNLNTPRPPEGFSARLNHSKSQP